MKNVIAFSLWGNDKLYCQGALDNIECAKEYYPGWTCKFYVAENCPAIPVLQNADCEIAIIQESYDAIDRTSKNWVDDPQYIGMLWRFYALDNPSYDAVIFRDCDSRVGPRDAQAVKEWLDSDLPMHRMHECKEHWNAQVMGGMWGIRKQYIKKVYHSIQSYIKIYKGIRNEPWIFIDLWWIMDMIWPHFSQRCMGHGYGHSNSFKVDGPPVGSVVNEEWRGKKYV